MKNAHSRIMPMLLMPRACKHGPLCQVHGHASDGDNRLPQYFLDNWSQSLMIGILLAVQCVPSVPS